MGRGRLRGLQVRNTRAWLGVWTLAGWLAMTMACPTKDEVLQKAEESGKFLAEKQAQVVKGVGEGLKKSGKESAESLSQGVGEVIKGTVQGFDKSLGEVRVTTADAVTVAGLRVERGQRRNHERSEGVTLYLISDRAFEGKLMLRAIDGAGKEVGRSTVELKRAAGDAGYVDFVFDERTPLLTMDRVELGVL